jgi:hypothetical protein
MVGEGANNSEGARTVRGRHECLRGARMPGGGSARLGRRTRIGGARALKGGCALDPQEA